MAIVKSAAPSQAVGMNPAELEFKAEFFHRLWIIRKARAGQHATGYHSDPMKSPPPLRADGRSRCDQCCLLMDSYSKLPESAKEPARDIVLNIQNAEDAWRNRGK